MQWWPRRSVIWKSFSRFGGSRRLRSFSFFKSLRSLHGPVGRRAVLAADEQLQTVNVDDIDRRTVENVPGLWLHCACVESIRRSQSLWCIQHWREKQKNRSLLVGTRGQWYYREGKTTEKVTKFCHHPFTRHIAREGASPVLKTVQLLLNSMEKPWRSTITWNR